MNKLQAALFYSIISVMTMTGKSFAVEVENEALDHDVISIYGTGCENTRVDEAKSSARVRVTDKASFKAVEEISMLKEYKDKVNSHDYNVMVYNLVDNDIQDLTIRTTSKDAKKICVEVTGFIDNTRVVEAINDLLKKAEPIEVSPNIVVTKRAPLPLQEIENTDNEINPTKVLAVQEDYPEKLVIEKDKVVPDSPTPFPPRPNLKVEISENTAPVVEKEVDFETDFEEPVYGEEKRSLVYVAPTKFFNDTASETTAGILASLVKETDTYHIAKSKDGSDYTISSSVLRAKVDPINGETNRMQMIISVQLEDNKSKESFTEHQNRFVLYSTSEEEQKVASELLGKLFEKAGQAIMQKMNQLELQKGKGNMLPKIITPTSSTYREVQNQEQIQP